MNRRLRGAVSAIWTFAILLFATPALAVIVASDDASNSPYSDGWAVGDNGGTGFAAWSTINNLAGSGSGGGFVASDNGFNQIGTGSPAKGFGLFGNGGGVGQAIRSFASPINVGEKFSMDMDNGFIDTGGTVGFGLQNAGGNNLVEFFFVGGESSYKVNRSGGSVATGVGFTNAGLHLELTLTDADSFELSIDRLTDGLGTNVTTVSGDLISPAGGQAIARMRLFNANAGNGGDHDAFYNSFTLTAVPEASAVVFFGVASVVSGVHLLRRKRISRPTA
jgi:hypothetical protein